MAPAKQLLGSKPVSARHLRHRRFARERLRDDLRLGLRRPASPPACPRNHLDPAEVPSVSVKRMVIHMVKPIPMTESGPSRITIAHAMWGRNYAYEGRAASRNQSAVISSNCFRSYKVSQRHKMRGRWAYRPL